MSEHYWTVFEFDVECGTAAGAHLIPAGDPVRVIGRAIRRCEEHASVPVDAAEVDAARHAIEVARATASPRTPGLPTRMRAVRPPVPFSSLRDVALPFDSRAAAAGDKDA